jgi:2-aminoethylphosphonate-pyruvate transaminase
VKSALVHHDVCHRDQDFTGVVRRLRTKLGPVFGAGAGHEVLVLTGSGTAAMEMAVTSVVPPGKAILTIENGAFGERLGEIAELHGLPHVTLKAPWGSLIEPADVEAALAQDPRIAAVAMIHHETSVGIMNPVAAIGRLCRARGVTSVVDAVSSLGVEDLDVERDQIDVCFSSANKCLHSVSGVSFVCVAPEVWARIERPRRGLLPGPPALPPLFHRAGADALHPGGVGLLRPGDGARTSWPSRAGCRPGGRSTGGATCSSAAC